MAKLTWDADGQRLYETGTKNGVFYPKGDTEGYGTGVAWNGLTAVTESPSGADSNPIYADDMKYIDIRGAEEFGGTIECYTYPDEFAECDGSKFVIDGVKVGQQNRRPFGFCYRSVIGNDAKFNDYGYKLHLIYNASVSPSEKGYQTVNDSPEAITFSYEFTSTPVNFNADLISDTTLKGLVKDLKATACITIDSTKVDADKLEDLEELLYGTANSEPTLPSPEVVLTTLYAA